MFIENSFGNFAWMVGLSAPFILAAIGGLVWAIINWKKSSQPAMIAAIACGVMVLFSCIFPAIHTWGPRVIFDRNAGPRAFENFVWFLRTMSFSQSLCWGLCIGALAFAVFAGRAAEAKKNKDKKKRAREDDEEEEEQPRSKSRKDEDEGIQDKPRSKRPRRDDDDD